MDCTPTYITELNENEIFVFGSNLAGRHGAGAAKIALKWGAVYGQGVGLHGNTYAIPTKDGQIKTLPINIIKQFVDDFILFAENNTELKFLVTAIGCGLAGYKETDIAPLFKDCVKLHNVVLPMTFIEVLNS